MNKKNSVVLLASLTSLFLPFTGKADGGIDAMDERYQRCSALARELPSEAVAYGSAWEKQERTATSLHCHSIALYAAGRYSESARKLMAIHAITPKNNLTMRASLKRQASRAWLLGGEPDTALKHLSQAIRDIAYYETDHPTYKRVAVELLMERSDVYMYTGEPFIAVQDLDHAETFGVMSDNVLVKRAEAYMLMGSNELATNDINSVLKHNPSNRAAQNLAASF
jgi:tetratricopeptide (TPR) repeat protein